MRLPPILYHYFRTPLPYERTLALQEQIHQIQLNQRKTETQTDVLLLLQHRPVYTAGRRQTEDEVKDERLRLTQMGADFMVTARGGIITYHGPGQIVGYPLLNLSTFSPTLGTRDYICKMQRSLESHLQERHGIKGIPSDNTGVFLDPFTKIASIGVQVRHRMTTHGFSLNVTREPQAWFGQVVACGLADVKAGSIESATGRPASVVDEIPGLVDSLGSGFGREMQKLNLKQSGEVGQAIEHMESEIARLPQDWPIAPMGRHSN